MAVSLSNAFIAQFDSEVKQTFQGESKLMGTMRTRNGVVGSTHQFPIIGKGLAQQVIPQADVTPMNVQWDKKIATLEDWVAPEYTSIFNQQKVNFDEKRELVKAIAGAMGRRLDEISLVAMDAGANATQIDQDVGGANTGLNIEKLIKTAEAMNARGVPASNRHFAMSAYGLSQLLAETEITSSDYNVIKALVRGDIDTFMNFKFHMIEDRAEGGITKTGNIRKNFAWHHDAIGLAIGINISTEINYVAEKLSWLCAGKLSAGSVVIDDGGVFEVLSYEA